MNTTQKTIVTLLKSGLAGEKLQLPDQMELEEVFKIIRKQSVMALAYQGAVNCGIEESHPLMQKLFLYCCQNLIRSERQMQDVEKIFEVFEQNQIAYMPLKGCNLKKLYPKQEYRSMGDADILIHPEDHLRIKSALEAIGFQYHGENDHVFEWKSDALHVELHKSVVPVTDPDYFTYYGTGWQLAVKGDGYRHDLSLEDAYLFMFTHFARHYRSSGIGCRHVLDLYVYRNAYPDMDWGYISRELRKLRLLEFHENMLRMLEVWFEDREEDEISCLATNFIFSGGNWGTMEANVYSTEVKRAQSNGGVQKTKWKAFCYALFLPREKMTYRYKAVRKYPWLLPVFWVIRLVDAMITRPWKMVKKLRILKAVDDNEILSHEKALRMVGLDFGDAQVPEN